MTGIGDAVNEAIEELEDKYRLAHRGRTDDDDGYIYGIDDEEEIIEVKFNKMITDVGDELVVNMIEGLRDGEEPIDNSSLFYNLLISMMEGISEEGHEEIWDKEVVEEILNWLNKFGDDDEEEALDYYEFLKCRNEGKY